jgi:hypothetical protein
LGSLFFLLGGGIALVLIIQKLVAIANQLAYRQVTDQPLFYIALLAMILGMQLFLAGFLGELISRSSNDRNKYLISKKI